MLIPAIDIQGGRVVQLVQGERLALAFDDLDAWLARFARFPLVQVIDLDAAKGTGRNDALVRRACAARPCRVGGGLRTIDTAREMLSAGALEVILGSALFHEGAVNLEFAAAAAAALGRDRLIAAIDSRGGYVVHSGWTSAADLRPERVAPLLEPFFGGFLYTIVDGEGLMGGIDLEAVRRVRRAIRGRLTAAGGIRSQREVDILDEMGVDAVVGMAVYTGAIKVEKFKG
jgi:phosphoribosylformimino-5-aminoimidazole carboxamide ribotide isomerase